MIKKPTIVIAGGTGFFGNYLINFFKKDYSLKSNLFLKRLWSNNKVCVFKNASILFYNAICFKKEQVYLSLK